MKSLLKVLNIIDRVAEAGEIGIRELSSLTGYPPATIHRIVSTLVEGGYFQQDPVKKSYALSLRFLELGMRVQQRFHLATIARPHLEQLMAEAGESVNLAVRDADEVVYLDHVRCRNTMLQLFTTPGARVPLYATGVGKAFLSTFGDDELVSYLERVERKSYTPHTLVKQEALAEELRRIRERGFAVDDEEMEEGVRCVASLIFDHRALPVAAVSVSGAAMRLTPDRVDEFGRMVRKCAQEISRQLGHDTSHSRP